MTDANVFADGSLTVPEASRSFGVGRTKLFELMRSGDLPYTTCGRKRLIPRRALVALLAGRLVRNAPGPAPEPADL